MACRTWMILTLLGLASSSCLPKDTRPVPGSMAVTSTAKGPLLGAPSSVVTADGWTIAYDRFLVVLGGASLDGDLCASYYNADYRRILDMSVAGPQELSQLYALGPCNFNVRIMGPETNSLLGKGVSEADKTLLGFPGTDHYATNRGIGLFAKGQATKDAVTKTFTWAFRQRVSYSRCNPSPGNPGDGFDLRSGASSSLDLGVHGEALFADDLDPARATLRFEPFALADERGNGDGDVTLDELALVPLDEAQSSERGPPPADAGAVLVPLDASADGASTYTQTGDASAQVWTTLEDYVYLGQLQNILTIGADGVCQRVHVGDFRRD